MGSANETVGACLQHTNALRGRSLNQAGTLNYLIPTAAEFCITMYSSPSPENKDDHSDNSSESPLSRSQRGPPFGNQYHVYNFGEATGNTVGSPAYFYPGYDYYCPYYLPGCQESQPGTGSSDNRLGLGYQGMCLLVIF